MTFILKVEVSFVDHMNDNANATGFLLSPPCFWGEPETETKSTHAKLADHFGGGHLWLLAVVPEQHAYPSLAW